MMAEPLDCRALQPNHLHSPDRRLRNRLILGNIIVWIVILMLVRAILF